MKARRLRLMGLLLSVTMVLNTVSPAMAATVDIESASTTVESTAFPMMEEVIEENGFTDRQTDLGEVSLIVELEGEPLASRTPDNATVKEYLTRSAGKKALRSIEQEQEEIQEEIEEIAGNSVDCTYSVVLNGFAVEADYSVKEELEALPGVKGVYVAKTYAVPEHTLEDTDSVHTSGEMIQSDSVNAEGYTGKNTVTAILDTGLDVEHEAFQSAPESAKLTREDIKEVEKWLFAGAPAEDVYYNEKLPFVFDYADRDADVADDITHGTHVAGTVAGDGDTFKGVAPDSQLMICKVFGTFTSATSDSIIFMALEDCILLGVDAINMSLGSPGGFSDENELTDSVYDRVRDAGINLMVSAGNDQSSTPYNLLGTDLNYTTDPDNGIISAPSTYDAAMSVASVDQTQSYARYIQAGERHIRFKDANEINPYKSWDTLDGTYEYVVVPGVGSESDFAKVDVEGKVALVKRGDLTFKEKEANAVAARAGAVIIYDNEEGKLLDIQADGLLPVITISKADGEYLVNRADRRFETSPNLTEEVEETAVRTLMSDFSSMGPSPDLSLKPEITAPGGDVYSTVPGGYGVKSGTSMAAPHLTGAAAVLQQYLDENFANITELEKQDLIDALLMSTATQMVDEDGVAYTPRKQGAGLINVSEAISTKAYLSVEGEHRPKAELGENREGTFTVTFQIHNISNEILRYTMDSINLVPKVEVIDGEQYMSEFCRELSADEFTIAYSQDTVTVPANGSVEVTVNMQLTEAGKESLSAYTNGIYIDGFVLLEAEQDGETDLSLPYLGFYGDWDDAPIFDSSVYDDRDASSYATSLAAMNVLTGAGNYMGANLVSGNSLTGDEDEAEDWSWNEKWIAFNPKDAYQQFSVFSFTGLMRAPKSMVYTIRTSEDLISEWGDSFPKGTTVYRDIGYNLSKAFFYTSGGYMNYDVGPGIDGWLPVYDVYDEDGAFKGQGALPDGWYEYTMTATLDGQEEPQEFTLPIYLDSEKPELIQVEYVEEHGTPYVILSVTDNHFVMGVQLISESEEGTLSKPYALKETEQGVVSQVKIDISTAREKGFETAKVQMFDYALNETVTEVISITGEAIETTGDAMSDGAETTPREETSNTTIETSTWPTDNHITTDGAYVIPANLNTGITIGTQVQNVTLIGSAEHTEANPYQGLHITSQASDLKLEIRDLHVEMGDESVIWFTSGKENVLTISGNNTLCDTDGNKSQKAVVSVTKGYNGDYSSDLTLTIKGAGTLSVTSGNGAEGAAIGGDAVMPVGEIVVDSGNIQVFQKGDAAGIGAGEGGGSTDVVINGGNLHVVSSGRGAAIGGAYKSDFTEVTIHGGTVTAENTSAEGVAIGLGKGTNSASYIFITGGSVKTVAVSGTRLSATPKCEEWDASYEFIEVREAKVSVPNVTGVSVDGVDWKIDTGHAEDEDIYLWLPVQLGYYQVSCDTPDGNVKYQVSVDEVGVSAFRCFGVATTFSNVTAKYNNVTAYRGKKYSNVLVADAGYQLPDSIAITIDGILVEASYDATTGRFTIPGAKVTGEIGIVVTAIPTDRTKVERWIAKAEAFQASDYTSDSYAVLRQAITAANGVLSSGVVQELEGAVTELQKAIAMLVPEGYKEELTTLVEQVTEHQSRAEDYTMETWSALFTVLQKARKVLADEASTVNEVTKAYQMLQDAYHALSLLTPDYSYLNSLLEAVAGYQSENYTVSTWNALQLAVAEAELIAVTAGQETTVYQSDINEAKENLRSAIRSLRLRQGVDAPTCSNHVSDEGEITKTPTCTVGGLKVYRCMLCNGVVKTDPVEALGHDFATEYTIDKPASCKETGSKSQHCSRCDARQNVTEIPTAEHQWKEKSKVDATCSTEGAQVLSCTTCNKTKTEVLPALGHDYATEYTVDKAASYSEAGSKSQHCSRCDARRNVTVIEVLTKRQIGAVSGVKAVLYGYDDVKVSWKKASGANAYQVYYKKGSASKYTYLGKTTGTSYKKSNLAGGVKYTFKVVPCYMVGKEVQETGAAKTAYVYTLKKLNAPKVVKVGSGKVKVSWNNINGETGYQISISTSKKKTKIVKTYATTSGKSKTCKVSKNKRYYYKVRAYKKVGNTKIYGPWSKVKSYKCS